MDKMRLKYFLSAARHLNFTKAAEDCHVVQGTISKQIVNLEKELGVLLFIRKGQTLKLTSAGEKLLDDAYEHIEQYEAIEQSLRRLHLIYDTRLRIASGTMEHHLVVPALKNLYKNHSNVEVLFSTYTYARMAAHLRNDTLDIGICSDACADNLKYIENIHCVPIYSGPWIVCALPDSPFWSLPKEKRGILEGQIVISITGNEYDAVHTHCVANNYPVKSFLFSNALLSVITLVMGGAGVAVLPPHLENKIDGLRMERVLNPPLTTGFSLVYKSKAEKLDTIKIFTDFYERQKLQTDEF